MPLRSVLSVDVDDTAFQRFQSAFDKYRAALDKMPGMWSSVGKAAGTAGDASVAATRAMEAGFANMTAALLAHHELLAQATSSTEHVTGAATGLSRVWSNIVGGSRRFVGFLETSILRMGTLTTLGAGLLGIGGLWGLESYAESAGRARRTAQGLGVTVPELTAFGTEYQRYFEPGQFLGAVNRSLVDIRHRSWLYGLGLTDADLNKPGGGAADTAVVAQKLLPRIWNILHQFPEQQVGQTLEKWGIPFSDEEGRRLYETPYTDLNKAQENYRKDLQKFGIGLSDQDYDKAMKNWQEFNIQLERSGNTIWSVFGVTLSKWAPQLGILSNAFAKLVQDLVGSQGFGHFIDWVTEGLKNLNKWISSKTFEDDVKRFATSVGDAATVIGIFGAGVLNVLSSIENALDTFNKSTGGKDIADSLNATSDWANKAGKTTRDWLGKGYDWVKDNIHDLQFPGIIGTAHAEGLSTTAQAALLSGAMGEGGIYDSWKGGDKGTSFGPWQLHEGGELDRYLNEGNKPGDIKQETAYIIKRLNEIDPGFSKLTDPDRAIRDIWKFERSIQGPDYYAKNMQQALHLIESNIEHKKSQHPTPYHDQTGQTIPISPNVQRPAPVHIIMHGNTGAVTPVTANAVAGGAVY